MKCRLLSLVMAMLMLLTLFTACGEKKPAYENGGIDPKFDGKLEFDHAMELEYAKCFSVDYYKGGYKIAKTVDGTTMLIVPEGMSVPADAPAEAIILQQPVSNLLVSSTPVTSLINLLVCSTSLSSALLF